MKPYVAWSQAQAFSIDIPNVIELETSLTSEFEDELSFLFDAMVQNLMAASSNQLRQTLKLMEVSREAKVKREQEALFANEISRIEEKTASLVSEALVPVLSDLHLSRVMSEFVSVLKKVLPEFSGKSVLINAPHVVHGILTNALLQQSITAELLPDENPEISAIGANVVLRADLEQWSKALKKVAAP
jgi:hypothetical protein